MYFILFPQGTQSANPHNDYCQHFVDTGQRPQNFIRDVGKQSAITNYITKPFFHQHYTVKMPFIFGKNRLCYIFTKKVFKDPIGSLNHGIKLIGLFTHKVLCVLACFFAVPLKKGLLCGNYSRKDVIRFFVKLWLF